MKKIALFILLTVMISACACTGTTGTTAATALLSEYVSIPVLAAGGIVNEKMAKAAGVVEAKGVFVGTRQMIDPTPFPYFHID